MNTLKDALRESFVHALAVAAPGDPIVDALADALADAAHATVTDPDHHHYLSTGCLHGNHAYCQGDVTIDGRTKIPARCKFCSAPCECSCHTATTDPVEPVSGV